MIERIAKETIGWHVREIQFVKDNLGHDVMILYFYNGYQLRVILSFWAERPAGKKFLHQIYHLEIFSPDKEKIMQKQFVAAKMIKMAILKTKKLDILKGESYGINSKRSGRI